jgi:hypothetical protein
MLSDVRSRFKRQWPLWAVLISLWLMVIVLLITIVRRDDGVFTYALDDAYIHLSIGNHFALQGVWGVTRYEFSASTSSPGWTLMLSSLIALVGPSEAWPLVLNVLLATAVIVLIDCILRSCLHPPASFLALVFIVLSAPVPALIYSGMEHLLHILLITAVFAGLRRYESAAERRAEYRGGLWFLVGLAGLVRYETIFLIGPLAVYYAWRRHWRLAAGLLIAAFIGPIILGFIQIAHGWYFFPNSLLAKGANISLDVQGLISLFERFATLVGRSGALFVLAAIVALWLIFRLRRGVRPSSPPLGWALAWLSASVLQYTLAQVGWMYRYEAYLLVFGYLLLLTDKELASVVARFFAGQLRPKAVTFALFSLAAIMIGIVFGYRIYHAMDDIAIYANAVYRVDYHVAQFIRSFYRDGVVVVGDIGEVSYQTDAHILDLWGLANRESLAALRAGDLDADFIDAWTRTHGAQVAMIHDVYQGEPTWQVPSTWIRVGIWIAPDYLFGANSAMSFYAVTPAEAGRLADLFRQFSTQVPSGVTPKLLYHAS